MKKLLLLLLIASFFITGCKNNNNNKGARYALIHNDSHNLETEDPKVILDFYDQEGEYLNQKEYHNTIQRIEENETEIFLYGDHQDILIYDKNEKDFSTTTTNIAKIEQLNLREEDYLIHRNLGFHDESKLTNDFEAILYNREHKEMQHYQMLDVEEQIVDAKATEKIVVLFTDSLHQPEIVHRAHIIDKESGINLLTETFENSFDIHLSLLQDDNIYYLTNQGMKDINKQKFYSFPEEIIKLFDNKSKVIEFAVFDNLWYLTINNSIYQLVVENDRFVIKEELKDNNEIVFSHLNNKGELFLASKDKDDLINFYQVSDNMKKEKLPIKPVKAKDEEKIFSMIIAL